MRKKKTLYTAESLFNVIMNELKSTGKVPDILEYAIPTRDKIAIGGRQRPLMR